MMYVPTNSQEESLNNIARQMGIANTIEVMRDLYKLGAINKEEYLKNLDRVMDAI